MTNEGRVSITSYIAKHYTCFQVCLYGLYSQVCYVSGPSKEYKFSHDSLVIRYSAVERT